MYYPTLEDFREASEIRKHNTGIPINFSGYGNPSVRFLQIDA